MLVARALLAWPDLTRPVLAWPDLTWPKCVSGSGQVQTWPDQFDQPASCARTPEWCVKTRFTCAGEASLIAQVDRIQKSSPMAASRNLALLCTSFWGFWPGFWFWPGLVTPQIASPMADLRTRPAENLSFSAKQKMPDWPRISRSEMRSLRFAKRRAQRDVAACDFVSEIA